MPVFLWQVAALNCGDFYNGQYVKMYGIFMGQLQVMLLLFIGFVHCFNTFSFSWLCTLSGRLWYLHYYVYFHVTLANAFFMSAGNASFKYQYPRGIFKWK